MRRLGHLLALLTICIAGVSTASAQAVEATTKLSGARPMATNATSQPTTETTTAPSTEPTTVPATQAVIAPSTQQVVPPVALADISEQISTAYATIQGIEKEITPEALNPPFEDDLATLAQQLDAQQVEAKLTLSSQPSADVLRTLAGNWQAAAQPLSEWNKTLTAQAARLDQDVATLAQLGASWSDRLKQAQASAAPDDVVKRLLTLLDTIQRTRSATEKGRSQIISLQNRVQEQYTRVGQMNAAIKIAQDTVVDRLLAKDAEPIWTALATPQASETAITGSQTSLDNQWLALKAYCRRMYETFIAHGLIAVAFIAALFWVRQRVVAWVTAEPDLKPAFDVFYFPIATGLVLSVVASIWIYTQAPHLLWVILGAAMVIPSIYLLRQLLSPNYYPVLNGLAVFYACDQVRNLLESQALLSRVLFLIEMLAGVIFVIWLLRGDQLRGMANTLHVRFVGWLMFVLRIAGVAFLASFIANLVGYVGLAKLIGGQTLISAYVAMIFYTAAEILDGLIMATMRLWPLTLLNLVKHQRDHVYSRFSLAMRWVVLLFWIWFALDLFAVRGPVLNAIDVWIHATLKVGPLELSLWNVARFVFVIWASFALSRFIRFVLDEDVYPRLDLPRGTPYAISTVLHYALLLMGFFTALGVLKFPLTDFTILTGAFAVGLGFGLQNIVNNFISGIILLFERPLKQGDTIEIDGLTGVVRRIGIRASIIRTTLGSELIVPNARFISEKVTNWTFSTGQRAIQLTVNVAPDSDPQKVIDVLVKTARDLSLLTDDPTPQALLSGFSAGAMTFDLQAWTKRYEDWTSARSELGIKIVDAFKVAGIVLK